MLKNISLIQGRAVFWWWENQQCQEKTHDHQQVADTFPSVQPGMKPTRAGLVVSHRDFIDADSDQAHCTALGRYQAVYPHKPPITTQITQTKHFIG